ncbi:hypothetical protein [Prauserella flavalba]|uniref:Tetratricopeptide repeat protein n=1 Tax=Prauserella flavalba TaxID=1477506 RepID=A0A318LFZ2_9PSEU|nr:hypothetical protein [Prauserella flavalba]PXY21940.1 hypothetical protein BA062_30825 [Prauserella flavalba]
MNPDNPVVRLCAEGMAAEASGDDDAARALFEQAWAAATDDYEACVAAHYLARHQPTPELTLHWNAECLRLADRVGDERVAGFYASLHANLGRCHRDLGDRAAAGEHFRLAARHLADVPAGPYRDWLRYSIADGLRGTGALEPSAASAGAEALLRDLCARGDLRSLCLLLPAYYGDTGSAGDRRHLAEAARMLHAERRLPASDQQRLGEIIGLATSTVD